MLIYYHYILHYNILRYAYLSKHTCIGIYVHVRAYCYMDELKGLAKTPTHRELHWSLYVVVVEDIRHIGRGRAADPEREVLVRVDQREPRQVRLFDLFRELHVHHLHPAMADQRLRLRQHMPKNAPTGLAEATTMSPQFQKRVVFQRF